MQASHVGWILPATLLKRYIVIDYPVKLSSHHTCLGRSSEVGPSKMLCMTC